MSVTVAGMIFTKMPAGFCTTCGYPRWNYPVNGPLTCKNCSQRWTDEDGQPLEQVLT